MVASSVVDFIPYSDKALSKLASEIKTHATDRWPELLCNCLSPELLEKGSHDGLFLFPDFKATGAIGCRDGRFDGNNSTGDGINTYSRCFGITPGEAIKQLASKLGIETNLKTKIKRDPIKEVCAAKNMPVASFLKYGAHEAKRGRYLVARVPMWNESGEKQFDFDLSIDTPQLSKGMTKKNSSNGLFLPGRAPQPGEQWLLVEGVKDSSSLDGLGYNAVGMQGCMFHPKFCNLFKDIDLIIIPDNDIPGQDAARRTAGILLGVAKSVKIARLPGEIKATRGEDVRDILKKPNGERMVREAIANATLWTLESIRKALVLLSTNLSKDVDAVTKHLGEATPSRPHRQVYCRAGQLVHVVSDDKPTMLPGGIEVPPVQRIRPIPSQLLPVFISECCELERELGAGTTQAVPAPRALVDAIHSAGQWDYIKPLDAIASAPTFLPSGEIIQEPGYNSRSRTIYSPSCEFPPISLKPTKDDALLAVAEILEVIQDFQFRDQHDVAAWLAYLLTLIGRPLVTGCVPLFVFTGNCPGVGKTLAAEVANIIVYGRPVARRPYSPEDQEMRKQITSTILEAMPSVLLDNIDTVLRGAALDAILTATTWNDRRLGTNATTGDLPALTVWAASGNQVRLGSDLARRVLPIRLEAKEERPEDRTGFTHSNIVAWVYENRAKLAVAAITILRAYIVAGKPEQAGSRWGSFEEWTKIIRGSIVWLGLPDPLETRATARADDESSSTAHALVIALQEMGEPLTAREIVTVLARHTDRDGLPTFPDPFPNMRDVCAEHATIRGGYDASKLGIQFRKYIGRVVEIDGKKLHIKKESAHGGVKKWSVAEA